MSYHFIPWEAVRNLIMGPTYFLCRGICLGAFHLPRSPRPFAGLDQSSHSDCRSEGASWMGVEGVGVAMDRPGEESGGGLLIKNVTHWFSGKTISICKHFDWSIWSFSLYLLTSASLNQGLFTGYPKLDQRHQKYTTCARLKLDEEYFFSIRADDKSSFISKFST